MVTVALGDDFRVSIVRTVMRTMVLLGGQTAGPESRLPSRSRIEADLATLRAKLHPLSAATTS
jgi:hypothetical protein